MEKIRWALAALLVPALWAGLAGEARASVDVYPSARTPTASPATQISFRGIAPSLLRHISVIGTSTGRHTGRLFPHSDGLGASFVPDHRFRRGERVIVRASVPLTGAVHGVVRFGIAGAPGGGINRTVRGDPGGRPVSGPRLRSRPDLLPPAVDVTQHTQEASSDDLFLAVKAGAGPDGPLILDSGGGVVWFRPLKQGVSAYDFRTQSYQGRPVLSWWQGRLFGGKGRGEGLILDSSYTLVARVRAGNGYGMDQHEFVITPEGTALIAAYEPVRWNTAAAGGKRRGVAWDSIVQEIDIKTGLVLFEWHSLGNVPVSDTYYPPGAGGALDYFHVNSIDREPDGDLLLSARAANALFEVDRHSGRVLWQLGGRRSDFQMGPGTRMIGQHQATRLPDGSIAVFDNGGALGPPAPRRESRAIVLAVDTRRKVVQLARSYRHPEPPLRSLSQGSMQTLPTGNVFVSWGGSNHYLTEFTAGGAVAFDARLATDDTYRAYRLPWSATPATPPALAAVTHAGRTAVYASWNGATGVAAWELLAGDTPASLRPVARASRAGFETRIALKGAPKLVEVQALGASGTVLGASAPATPRAAR